MANTSSSMSEKLAPIMATLIARRNPERYVEIGFFNLPCLFRYM